MQPNLVVYGSIHERNRCRCAAPRRTRIDPEVRRRGPRRSMGTSHAMRRLERSRTGEPHRRRQPVGGGTRKWPHHRRRRFRSRRRHAGCRPRRRVRRVSRGCRKRLRGPWCSRRAVRRVVRACARFHVRGPPFGRRPHPRVGRGRSHRPTEGSRSSSRRWLLGSRASTVGPAPVQRCVRRRDRELSTTVRRPACWPRSGAGPDSPPNERTRSLRSKLRRLGSARAQSFRFRRRNRSSGAISGRARQRSDHADLRDVSRRRTSATPTGSLRPSPI